MIGPTNLLKRHSMQIEALLQRLDKGGCPSPSQSTLALTELLQQDDAGIADAAKLIRVDPVLTAKIIKIANSALYGKSRRVMAIEEALMRIGLKVVVPLALGLTLASKTFSTPPNFDLRGFWAGSLLRAIAMHALAARTDEWPAADVFTVGLLCEIGSLFMACTAPAEAAALASQNLPTAALLDQEKVRFGFDHRQLSAALLRHWRVPENIVLALESHRNIADARSGVERARRLRTLRAIVEDGRNIASWVLTGASAQSITLLQSAAKIWWFSDARFERMISEIIAEWEEIAGIFDQTVSPDLLQKLEVLRETLITGRLNSQPSVPGPILLVSNQTRDLDLLQQTLKPEGYNVIQADSADDAIVLLYQKAPRIIILDWDMLGITGAELCVRWRREFGPRVYLLVLADTHHGDCTAEALEAGANDIISKPPSGNMLVAKLAIAAQMVTFIARLENSCTDLTHKNQSLQDLASKDVLTGLANRRGAQEFLSENWRHAIRHQHPLSCIMLDIDYFKQVNDEHGHDVGDRVLQALGGLLLENSRSGDLVARVGGEEFLILCPQSDELKASLYAERLCQEAAQMQGDFPPITLSAGVAQMQQPDMENPEALLRAADQALLLAKRRGRSQIIIASTQRNPR